MFKMTPLDYIFLITKKTTNLFVRVDVMQGDGQQPHLYILYGKMDCGDFLRLKGPRSSYGLPMADARLYVIL